MGLVLARTIFPIFYPQRRKRRNRRRKRRRSALCSGLVEPFSLSGNVGDPAFPAIHQKLGNKHIPEPSQHLDNWKFGVRAEVSVRGDTRRFQLSKSGDLLAGAFGSRPPVFTLENDRNVPPHFSRHARYISKFFFCQKPL